MTESEIERFVRSRKCHAGLFTILSFMFFSKIAEWINKRYKIKGVYLFLAISYTIPFLYFIGMALFWLDLDNLLICITWAWGWILVVSTMVVFFDRAIRRVEVNDESEN